MLASPECHRPWRKAHHHQAESVRWGDRPAGMPQFSGGDSRAASRKSHPMARPVEGGGFQ
jgi:hypothetical protein